jgi:hypothetical protein
MSIATQHYWPATDELREAPEGVWFEMTDGNGSIVRCLLERAAWAARDRPESDMLTAIKHNWPALVMLASQKLSLADPTPVTEIHLTADDLFNIPWETTSGD